MAKEEHQMICECGVELFRVGRFAVADDLATGRLVALLEDYNPQDHEALHAVFVGGSTTPTRVRVFVDYLVERLAVTA